jgi:hypothetical protein
MHRRGGLSDEKLAPPFSGICDDLLISTKLGRDRAKDRPLAPEKEIG